MADEQLKTQSPQPRCLGIVCVVAAAIERFWSRVPRERHHRYFCALTILALVCIDLSGVLPHAADGSLRIFHPVAHWFFDEGIINYKVVQDYTVRTAYGDVFSVAAVYRRDVDMFHSSCDIYIEALQHGRMSLVAESTCSTDEINSATAENFYPRLDLTGVYDSPTLRCYELSSGSELFWTVKSSGKYDWTAYEFLQDKGPPDDPLLPFARDRFATGKWHWVKIFSMMLMRCEDSGAWATVQRYARGQFTREELADNPGGVVPAARKQQWARKLLAPAERESVKKLGD